MQGGPTSLLVPPQDMAPAVLANITKARTLQLAVPGLEEVESRMTGCMVLCPAEKAINPQTVMYIQFHALYKDCHLETHLASSSFFGLAFFFSPTLTFKKKITLVLAVLAPW